MVVPHLGRLEGRVLHLLAGQRLEPAIGNVGSQYALLLLLLESCHPGACLLGALLRLLLVGGDRWLCRRPSTALVSTVIRAMFIAGVLAPLRILLLLSTLCLACIRLIVLRPHCCHAVPPPWWGLLVRPLGCLPILVARHHCSAPPWLPAFLLSLHLSLRLPIGLKVIALLVAAARLRCEGLQHGAAREPERARRLGGVEAIAVDAKMRARGQLKAEHRITQRQRRIDGARLHIAVGRLHHELIWRRPG